MTESRDFKLRFKVVTVTHEFHDTVADTIRLTVTSGGLISLKCI